MQTRSRTKRKKAQPKVIPPEKIIKEFVEQIYTGMFFELPDLELVGRRADMNRVMNSLARIKLAYFDSLPNVVEVADSDEYTIEKKQKILERLHALAISEVGSDEYYRHLRYLHDIKKPHEHKDVASDLDTTDTNKNIIRLMNKSDTGTDSESEKFRTWVDNALRIPFGKYHDSAIDIDYTRATLDENLSFLEEPKDRVINMLVKLKMNKASSMQSILIYGQKGTGKTALAKSIAKALKRPFKTIPLAGESDCSVLSGHHFTYTGAVPGRLISVLAEAKCMNPVILFDEVDKVSATKHGKDIIGTLIHMTDTGNNNEYSSDRYYNGMQFDLSKVVFIFTANSIEDINPILLDRLFKIKVRHYTLQEEKTICERHIIPDILKEYKLTTTDIVFPNSTLDKILTLSKRDNGLRELRDILGIIISRVVTLVECEKAVKLGYAKLAKHYKSLPTSVLAEHVDTLLGDYKVVEPMLSMYM